ncbi:ABC transporter permease [Georgenia sp. MJ173]|uniref:ABC transporter permease n=1 Tax=Georgenia sunbinii TaxID=3117728 RepID=UPI002F26CBF9
MTTTTSPLATASRPGRRGLGTLIRTEATLFRRDAGAVFFALFFPVVLLLGMGLIIPGMTEPVTDMGTGLDGMPLIHLWAPVVVAVAVATVGLSTLPAYVAGYREHGVFRRMSTTPMRPAGVLLAHVVVSGVVTVLAIVLAVGAGALLLDIPMPQQPLLAVAGFVLATLALFAVGLLIAGVSPKASTASAIGMGVYFPMLFFAGLWLPIALMPDVLETIATFTPLGAASQVLTTAWFGGATPWLELAVMAGYAVVVYPLTAKVFRWS